MSLEELRAKHYAQHGSVKATGGAETTPSSLPVRNHLLHRILLRILPRAHTLVPYPSIAHSVRQLVANLIEVVSHFEQRAGSQPSQ